LVELAVPEKKLVVVAAEPVAFTKVKFCNVDEPVTARLASASVLLVMVPKEALSE
jgi:hypothetical protein